MPPAPSHPTKRKASTAFKPPKPSKPAATKSKPKQPANSRHKSIPTPASHLISSDDDNDNEDDDDDDDMLDASSNADEASTSSQSEESTLPPAASQSSDPPPTIPPALLTKLLHHHFKDRDGNKATDVRIGKDAMAVVGKYMETFVREAIARAAFERQEEIDKRGKKGLRREIGDDFLEVEDLEKLAPQLLLDF